MRPSARWMLLAGLASIGTAKLASWLLAGDALAPPWQLLLALLPIPFFIGFIWAELAYWRALDELHRRIALDALAVAFPAAIALGYLVESLQQAGFLAGVGIGDVWPWMGLLWLPALLWSRARYA